MFKYTDMQSIPYTPMLTNTGQCSQIHTNTDTYRHIPANTYNTYHYLLIHTNTDWYIPHILIHTIHPIQIKSDQYILIHTNTY